MTSWVSFRRGLPSHDNFAMKHNKCDNLHGAPVDNNKYSLETSVTPTFANIASTHSTEDYIAKVGTLSLPSLTAHHIAEQHALLTLTPMSASSSSDFRRPLG